MGIDAALDGIEAARNRRGVARSRELGRVIALPRRALDLTVDLTDEFVLRPSPCSGCQLCAAGPPRLRSAQSAMLAEARSRTGLLGFVGVGEGKSLASLLMPAALAMAPTLLLVPAHVREQLLEVDVPRYARHFKIPLESITVRSYSDLSSPRTFDLLDRLKPRLIVCDEAHNLRPKSGSVRSSRFYKYLRSNPSVRLVAMSGSLLAKSLRDVGAISAHALGIASPLPISWSDLEEWCAAVDPDVESRLEPGALLELCSAGEAPRAGLQRRVAESPGVVVVADPDGVGSSLVVEVVRPPAAPAVRAAIKEVESTWSIGGEEHADALEHAAVLRELSLGFYYAWEWEDGAEDKEWLEARAEWRRTVREFLRHRSRPGLDSPGLVEEAARRGGLPADVASSWSRWAPLSEKPGPTTVARWLDDSALRFAIKAAGRSSIIWYRHRAVGDQLAKIGVDTFGAGTAASREVLRLAEMKDPGTVAMSIRAHGTGKNLQHAWSRNVVLGAPRGADVWQQLIGRTHRPGQTADEVSFLVVCPTADAEAPMHGAVETARFVQETTGEPQKLLRAQRLKW